MNSTLLLFSYSKKSEKASSLTCLTHRIKHHTKTHHPRQMTVAVNFTITWAVHFFKPNGTSQKTFETFCIKPPAHYVTKLCPEMAALQELTCDEGSLATSNDPTNLLLTSHRKNFSHSLTNMTDSCFGFFCQVDEVRLQNNKVAENRSSMPEQIRTKMIANQNLFEAWQKLFAHPNKKTENTYFLVMNSDNQINPRWQAGGGC